MQWNFRRMAAAWLIVAAAVASGADDWCRNPWFETAAPPNQALLESWQKAEIDLAGEQFPAQWSVTSHGKPAGHGKVSYRRSNDGPEEQRAVIRIETKTAPLTLLQGPMVPVTAGRHWLAGRVLARGKGTVRMGLWLYGHEYAQKGSGAYTGLTWLGRMTVTEEWQWLTVGPQAEEMEAKVGAVRPGLELEGEVEIAAFTLGPAEPVNPSSRLTFHLPFEGTMEAAMARGTTLPYNNAYAHEYVPGIAGQAARFDRRRGPAPGSAWQQFAIGATYYGEGNVPAEAGTIELWFRPLAAMLGEPTWRKFYLFAIPGQQQTGVYLEPDEGGKLFLRYREPTVAFAFPSGERVKGSLDGEHELPAEGFLEQWHHLALVYDTASRTIYLDGKVAIRLETTTRQPLATTELDVAWGGRWAPYTPYADLDEFRVWEGARYLDAFTPSTEALGVRVPGPVGAAAAGTIRLAGEARLGEGELIVPVEIGGEPMELALEVGDGLPYVLSSKGIRLGKQELVTEDPPIEALPMTDFQAVPGGASGRVPKYDLLVTMTVDPAATEAPVSVVLTPRLPEWQILVEPRLTLRLTGGRSWSHGFEGRGDRAATQPFVPFQAAGLVNIFPVNAAWGESAAVALELETECSWMRQGRPAPDRMQTACRLALAEDDATPVKLAFRLFTFDPRYGSDDAIARFQARHGERFRPSSKVDWRIYRGPSNSLAATSFYSPSAWKADKAKTFSMQELTRRAGAAWEWYYHSGATAGNWNYDPFLLSNLPRYAGLFGGLPEPAIQRQNRLNKFEAMDRAGIATGFYVLLWMEARLARYYRDSLISPFDTDRGVQYLDNWWTQGMRDYLYMPAGTRAGRLIHREIEEIVGEIPAVKAICLDVAEGDHVFRGRTELEAPATAFDREGAMVHYLTGMARVCAHVRELGVGIVGNPHTWDTSYGVMSRLDQRIYECRPFEIVANEHELRQDDRWFGSKPRSLYQTGYSDLVGNYYADPAAVPAVQLQREQVAVRMQILQRCLLHGMWPSPGLIYGVAEVEAAIPEVTRLIGLGRQFVTAAETGGLPVRSARYGTPAQGAWVLVNPAWQAMETTLRVDADYLGSCPIVAAADEETLSSRLEGETLTVGPLTVPLLGFRVADSLATIAADRAVPLAWTSRSKRSSMRMELELKMAAVAETGAVLAIGRHGYSVCEVTAGGQPVAGLVEGADGWRTPRIDLSKGASVNVVWSGGRPWSDLEAVLAFPLVTQDGKAATIAFATETAEAAARQLAEYVRFWTANTAGWPTVKPVVVAFDNLPAEAGPTVVIDDLARGTAAGGSVRVDEQRLTIETPEPSGMGRLMDALLRELDRKYPYRGRWGVPLAVQEDAACTTSEQKALLEAAKLPGGQFSVRELFE